MKKVIKLKESDLTNIIKRVLRENEDRGNRYMFFSNLEQMRRQCDLLLDFDPEMVESILETISEGEQKRSNSEKSAESSKLIY